MKNIIDPKDTYTPSEIADAEFIPSEFYENKPMDRETIVKLIKVGKLELASKKERVDKKPKRYLVTGQSILNYLKKRNLKYKKE